MKNDIFLSYSIDNQEQVLDIKRYIDSLCYTDCWIDLNVFESQNNPQFVVDNIDKCKVFLFFLSEKSMSDDRAINELNYAKETQKRVLLVNIDGCSMRGVVLLKFGLIETIDWCNIPQRMKLMGNIIYWIDNTKPISQLPNITLSEIEERVARLDKIVGRLDRFIDGCGTADFGFVDPFNDYSVVIPRNWRDKAFEGFREGLAAVSNSDYKWGYIDKIGYQIIPFLWDDAKVFSEKLAAVKNSNGKWGFIDMVGHVVIPCVWNDVGVFSEGIAAVKNNVGELGYIDKTGRLICQCKWRNALPFSEGMAAVMTIRDGIDMWGYIDKYGHEVIPCKWNNTYGFKEGLAAVQDNNYGWGFINRDGHLVTPCRWLNVNNFSEGLAAVRDRNYKYGFIDKNGRLVIPCQWSNAWCFKEGLAPVCGCLSAVDPKIKRGYIDKSGQIVISGQWRQALCFCDGIAEVQDDNLKWWKITRTGTIQK